MNKIWLFGASICMVLALGSCKPKQSAYKAAYEQAKEKESTAPVEVVEEEEVVEEVTPVSKPRTSNVSTRAEKINAAQGEDAKQTETLQCRYRQFQEQNKCLRFERTYAERRI